ncbi:energy-coupling factor ABC transporter ATP-binding protein [Rhizobiaceae bacterium BDR2-2]|uniref:Energy-coupling factor ABC transporter ATP-binding protein n=1 Tax=Ectorhizobium quercum TaxID=2965071 RepID=A0AAE3N0N7_9HYPH|nr:ABC transporter ATP-binding protein [Ectorhizobium quercum]MCX8996368.1 energy-coupling factor ABC transporter ATP-binding protein [Ectorhizobium quercum]MCX8998593.1 energy-coupling factor ABC transporter ATP-binding protein [Ectorhizobium quercum]
MNIRFEGAGVDFGDRTVLQPLTLSLAERRIGVIGLNGSGKSTFARLINGLVAPSRGRITLDGLDTVADAKTLAGRTGYIFQNPANQIIMPIVAEDMDFGLKNRGLDKAQRAAKIAETLEALAIAHLERRRAHELSGGELQLAALAAVLVTGPDLVILDEPTNQLDLKNRRLVERTMAGLSQQLIVISHDLALLDGFDRVLLFHEGRLAADAPPAEAVARYLEIAGA